jgi:hypothetical protein
MTHKQLLASKDLLDLPLICNDDFDDVIIPEVITRARPLVVPCSESD